MRYEVPSIQSYISWVWVRNQPFPKNNNNNIGGEGWGGKRFGNFVHRVQPLPFYQGSMVTLGYPGYVSIKIVYFNWFIHEQKGKIKTQANTRVWSEWILYLRKTQEVK